MNRLSTSKARKNKRKKQYLKVANQDQELDFNNPALSGDALSQDLEGQAELALKEIEEMRRRQLELSRHREELEEINLQKQEFLSSQGEINDKLSSSISMIERAIFEMKQEIEDMQRTRDSFALHLEQIEALEFRMWKREELAQRLDHALNILDRAEDDYDQAVDLFRGSRANIFSTNRRVKSSSTSSRGNGSFIDGIRFHAPLLLIGAIAIVVYILF